MGQPELRDILARPDLSQFAQRVSAHFHLGPMDADTVRAYIQHRLVKAGGRHDIFDTDACRLVYQHSGGVPRLVNQMADLCMVYAYANEDLTVTAETVQQVLDDGVFFAGSLGAESPRLVSPAAGKP